MARIFRVVLVWALFCADNGLAAARPDSMLRTSAMCEQAAVEAAGKHGVPLAVMRAIALTESGRRLSGDTRPWPWTVNMEGKGVWFDSRSDALAFAEKHHAQGARSFDVGCFQLNFRWHGKAFGSIHAMFDPKANADYAARFLAELFSEFGDWTRAAGAYHSRTPKFARKYEARFDRFLAELVNLPKSTPLLGPGIIEEAPRRNTFPLLQARVDTTTPGSLVPLPEVAMTGRFITVER